MKRVTFLLTAICIATFLQGQTREIDEFFDQYSEREGFTSVYISSKLLGLFSGDKSDKKEGEDIISRLKSIRILSVSDSLLNQSVNFYKELGRKMDLSAYEELMVVKEGNEITKFLIRQKGDIINELLVISGGPGNNSIISIRGDLDLKMIRDLSKDTGIDELKDLEKLEKNPKNEEE